MAGYYTGKRAKLVKAVIKIDGASRGNPGPSSYAFIIETEGFKIDEYGFIGKATNNQAEYTALIKALEKASELGIREIKIFTDSELLVNQIKGTYKVKSHNIRELFFRVMELLKKFENVEIFHIRREENKEADKLANLAFKDRNVG